MFLTIVLILVFWFILRPLFRILFGFYRLRKQVNDMFSQQQKGSRTNSSKGTHQAQGQQKKKKIIDPNVGEYVEFEEINTSDNRNSTTQTPGQTRYDAGTYSSGNNIEDVEWEDIKE